MADVTGTLRHPHDGKTYALRLTPLGIAALQDGHGNDFIARLEDGAMPNLRLFVGIVAQALVKGEGMPLGDAEALADDMVAADMGLPMRVLTAAFPQGGEGNGDAPAAGAST